jgi:uncharacterized protein YkwD
MNDWLQLTDEDIARATSLQRATRPEPAAPPPEAPAETLTITLEDLEPEAVPPTATEVSGGVLTITVDDTRPDMRPVTPTQDVARMEQLMAHLVNDARGQHMARLTGTANLNWHPSLAQIARQHSADMLRRQYVDHVSPEGVTVGRRLRQQHISYLACGENIGVVYGEAAQSEQAVYEIMRAFMNQPRSLTNHRANLLNPLWTHMGIGIAINPDGALVATQVFISAPAQKLLGE